MRSGRADWFRFAEAMTRHVSEVDVFHLGPWTGQGSRHNVVHYGCPCKEPRVSQAGAKRFYHYFTADERCRDLLDEVATQADQFQATNVPTDKIMARVGPTWAAWMANWFCAWERTGDRRWLARIETGLAGILQAPYKLLQGDPFDYDPATGQMTHSTEYSFPTNRLATIMGGAEVWMEYAEVTGDKTFGDALAEYGALYALPWAEAQKSLPAELARRLDLRFGCARLMAWAGAYRAEPAWRQEAWKVLIQGDDNPHEAHTWSWPIRLAAAPAQLSAQPGQDADLGTNNAAMGSLNLIACLALAPAELETAWARVSGNADR